MLAAAAVVALLVFVASRGAAGPVVAPPDLESSRVSPVPAPELTGSTPVLPDLGLFMPAPSAGPTDATVAPLAPWQGPALGALEALELAAREVAPWALTIPPRVAVAIREARAGDFERTRLAVALLSLPLTPSRTARPAAARADAALADARAAVARPAELAASPGPATDAAASPTDLLVLALPAGPTPVPSLPLGRFT